MRRIKELEANLDKSMDSCPTYSYKNALKTLNLSSLDSRRDKLCLKFANKAVKNPKHNKWFKLNKKMYSRNI